MNIGSILPANHQQDTDERAKHNPAPFDEATTIDIAAVETERSKNHNPNGCDDDKSYHVFHGIDGMKERAWVELCADKVGDGEDASKNQDVCCHQHETVELGVFRRHNVVVLYHFSLQ